MENNSEKINIKKYIGFYPFPNTLPNQKIIPLINQLKETTDYKTKIDLLETIKIEQMEKFISFQEGNHELIIFGNGLIQYRDDSIEEEIKPESNHDRPITEGSPKTHEAWGEYLSRLNLFYFLMDCASHIKGNRNTYHYEFSELTKNFSIVKVYFKDSQFHPGSDYTDNSLYHFAVSHCDEFIKNVHFYSVFDETIFQYSWQYFIKALEDENLFDDLNLIQKSLSEHNIHNYRNSFLLAWIFIEQFIFQEWKKLILSGLNKIYNGENKQKQLKPKKLKEYKDSIQANKSIPAGTMLSQLKENQINSIPEYPRLEKIKDIRDEIMHRNSQCTYQKSKDILEYAKKIIKIKYQLELNYNTCGHSTHGM